MGEIKPAVVLLNLNLAWQQLFVVFRWVLRFRLWLRLRQWFRQGLGLCGRRRFRLSWGRCVVNRFLRFWLRLRCRLRFRLRLGLCLGFRRGFCLGLSRDLFGRVLWLWLDSRVGVVKRYG